MPECNAGTGEFLLVLPAGSCSGRDSWRGSISTARSGIVTDSGSGAGGASCVRPDERSAAGASFQDVRSRRIIVLQFASYYLSGIYNASKNVWCSRDVGQDRSCLWFILMTFGHVPRIGIAQHLYFTELTIKA